MKAIKIPSFLHEVFGEQQSIATILVILAFGGCLTLAVSLVFPDILHSLPLWRGILALLLIFDIFCGCIANFTRSTSNFYAARKTADCVHRNPRSYSPGRRIAGYRHGVCGRDMGIYHRWSRDREYADREIIAAFYRRLALVDRHWGYVLAVQHPALHVIDWHPVYAESIVQLCCRPLWGAEQRA